MNTTPNTSGPAANPPMNAGGLLAEYPDFAGTPGQQHVRAFLPGLTRHDAEGVAHLVNGGGLVACPRCHFLHLPVRPFALGTDAPAGADGCDVCAQAARLEGAAGYDGGQEVDDLAEQIAAARASRAGVLLDLWRGPALDAELWLAARAEGDQ